MVTTMTFLGTSAAHPTEFRGLSCTCLQTGDGEVVMFDAGEGAQVSYMKAGLRWNKSMKILITHMHGDHCIGLLGMLQTMSLNKRTRPVEVFGPDGIEGFVYDNTRMLGFKVSFPLTVRPVRGGDVIGGRSHTIHVTDANHTVPALSYRFDENDRPGRFDRQKAVELGAPKESWKRLQAGHDVPTKDGDGTVTPAQVLGPPRRGLRIGVSGDTRPSDALCGFFEGCDYLVFDTTFLDEEQDRAVATGHSTATEAGKFAREARVKTLVMTHFSSRYTDMRCFVKEGKKFHDSIIVARDFMEIRAA